MAFHVYMLKCSDGSLYVGHTDDLDARLRAHRTRHYSGYTAKRLPVELIHSETFATRDDAFAAERQLKGWSRAKKLDLADGDWAEVKAAGAAPDATTAFLPSSCCSWFESLTMSGSGSARPIRTPRAHCPSRSP